MNKTTPVCDTPVELVNFILNASGLNKSMLAKLCDVHASSLGLWQRGTMPARRANQQALSRLAAQLRVPMSNRMKDFLAGRCFIVGCVGEQANDSAIHCNEHDPKQRRKR